MYNYAFFSDIECGDVRFKHGCREYLIKHYAELYDKADSNTNIYFGHEVPPSENDKYKEIYQKVCSVIWKNRIPFEITSLDAIKITTIKNPSVNKFNSGIKNPYHLDNFIESFPNLPLIRIPIDVFTPDISLVLYYSWWGINYFSDISMKKYLLTKVYSDIIPDYYTKEYTPGYCANESGNGPLKYLDHITTNNPNLIEDINNIYEEHKQELL